MLRQILGHGWRAIAIKVVAGTDTYQRCSRDRLHHRIRIMLGADSDREVDTIINQIPDTVRQTDIQFDIRVKCQQLRDERNHMQPAERRRRRYSN